jgi:signal transduction histidine kinase
MRPRLRQAIWLAAALIVPVLLSLALTPLRAHVSNVLIALVLLTVSAGALARGERLLSVAAAVSTALSFDYFFAPPYDQFSIRGAQGVETTVVLIVAVPAFGTWIGRLYGKEAARERELREKAERYAEEATRRQRQVEELAAELTASRRRILAVGDEMRRQIERDLHDGVQQYLVTLALLVRDLRDRVPADLRAEVDEVNDGLAATREEIRNLSRGLHPAILTEAGLGPAVRALARRSPLPVRVQLRADDRFPGSCEATAYYVAAEAFTNAAKHARATAIDILIERADGALTVQVRDDGAGGADASHGSGLIGLRDRVEAIGGTLTLDSPPGAGTVLTARLPVTMDLSERAVVRAVSQSRARPAARVVRPGGPRCARAGGRAGLRARGPGPGRAPGRGRRPGRPAGAQAPAQRRSARSRRGPGGSGGRPTGPGPGRRPSGPARWSRCWPRLGRAGRRTGPRPGRRHGRRSRRTRTGTPCR